MRRVLLILGSLAGCGASSDFQSGLPTRQELAIEVPGGGTTSGASQPELLGGQAGFCTMTVQISRQLNGAAESFFGQIDTALATPPSVHDDTHAIWGPFTQALSPVAVVLEVHRLDNQNYEFYLAGKPKNGPDSEYTGLM